MTVVASALVESGSNLNKSPKKVIPFSVVTRSGDRKSKKMDISMDDSVLPSLVLPKEEKLDFDDEFREKLEQLPRPRGRTRSLTKKPADKADIKAKLERSRQSARECRARKKLRYQYLEEIILETEKAIGALRKEMDVLKIWSKEMDEGRLPEGILQYRSHVLTDKPNSDPLRGISQESIQQVQFQQQQQQMQQQQQNSSSPGSSLGAGSLSPVASGLSVSPGASGMSSYMAMAMASSSQTNLLSQSLS